MKKVSSKTEKRFKIVDDGQDRTSRNISMRNLQNATKPKCRKESVDWIIDGLNNVRIRDYLGPLYRYLTPAKLLPDLKSATHLLYNEEKPKPKFHNKDNGKEHKTERKNFTCLNCKEERHAASACPKPRSNNCFLCNEPGHRAKDCRSKVSADQSTSEGSDKRVLHILKDRKRLKYFKEAFIKGKMIKSYVDPGSEAVALREDAAHELGLEYHESSERLTGYGNGRVYTLGELQAELSIDGVSMIGKIHVVPNEAQSIPLRVGQPFTNGVVYESKPYEITFMHASDDIKEITPEQEAKTPIWAKKAMVIPNYYVGFVLVHTISPNEDLCQEGGIREDGRMMPRCFISTDKEGMSKVPILNMTGKNVNIKEGTLLSRAETIES